MDADLLVIRERTSVFTDEGDRKRLAVHGLFTTGPVHKLILRLQKSTDILSVLSRPSSFEDVSYNNI